MATGVSTIPGAMTLRVREKVAFMTGITGQVSAAIVLDVCT